MSRKVTHGHWKNYRPTRTYKAWDNAKQKTTNPNHDKFHLYGGKGIMMCRKWRYSFKAFLKDMGEAPPGMSIDRIDATKGYFPGNTRWVTMRKNLENRYQKHYH